MYLYIVISALYRLSCGALIIAVNWLMVINSPSLGWLATTVALTFIPAMIVPLLWKNRAQKLSGRRLTQYSLLAAGVIAILMFLTDKQYYLLGLNTVIWFFFFVMESSWESWFASECRALSDKEIERFSSVTMSANQAALMTGPVIAAYIFENRPGMVICTSAILYFFCFIAAGLSGPGKPAASDAEGNKPQSDEKLQQLNLSGTEIALLLVWPTLAMFNFMLPAQVASANGNMTEVGLLDALMGIGMILSGFVVAHTAVNNIISKYKLNLVFLLAAILLWGFGGSLAFRLLSVLLLGLSFNNQRIVIRGRLAKKYQPEAVGRIISAANSFSFILISLSLLAFHNKVAVNWIIPFVFSIIMSLIIPLGWQRNGTNSSETSINERGS